MTQKIEIKKQAITFNVTGSVLRYGKSPLIAKANETHHVMNSFNIPNTDNHIFWKVENGVFVAMSASEKQDVINWYRNHKTDDLGDSGNLLNIDWSNATIKEVKATDNAIVTMTTTEIFTNGNVPDIKPQVLILIVRNQGEDKFWDWPNNTFWPVDCSLISSGINIFRFERYLDYYIGSKNTRF